MGTWDDGTHQAGRWVFVGYLLGISWVPILHTWQDRYYPVMP